MPNSQQPFPIEVRTSWVDYSPALRHHAEQRLRSRLAAFASDIRSAVLRISDPEPHDSTHRHCYIEVMTRNAGPISASIVSDDLFAAVDSTVERIGEILQERVGAIPDSDRRQRIA